MAAPTVYRWDDENAPVARGERRALHDILYACLVTGYGTKPAAGWTREYVNATFDLAAFRNNPATGTGFYLQVDGLGGDYAYKPKVRGFEAMTSESVGIGPFAATHQPILDISNGANTTPRPWVLIADDRFFYFFCYNATSVPAAPGVPANNATIAVLLFGDFVCVDQNDAYGCCIFAHVNTFSSMYATSQAATETDKAMLSPRPIAGTPSTPTPMFLHPGGGPGCDSGFGATGLAYTSGDIAYTRPYLDNKLSYTARGWLPGLYAPCHLNSFNQLAEVTLDGVPALSFRGITNSQYGNWFISLGDWRL